MTKRSFCTYLAIFTGTALLNVLAWNSKGFCDWYMLHILPLWVNTYGRVTGLLPFSLGEILLIGACILLLLFVLAAIVYMFLKIFESAVRRKREPGYNEHIQKMKGMIYGYYIGFSWIGLGIFVVMTLNCFICYHGTSFSDRYFPELERQEQAYSLDDLLAVRDFVVTKCNELSKQVERDADGNVVYNGDMEAMAVQCMQELGKEYEQLSGFYPKPKKISNSEFLSQQHMQGYFFPFTMEANINEIMKIMHKPATMCHELAHLHGFLQEDEANLIGYLACINSEDVFFQYSGYLSVLNYLDNDYYRAVGGSRQDYLSHVQILPAVRMDNQFLSEEAWEAVERKAVIPTETVDKISDEIVEVTLIMNGVKDGAMSYCRVVGLLLDYYSIQPEKIQKAGL